MSDFWKAVKERDLEAVKAALETSKEQAKATYPGEASKLDLQADSPFTNTALHYAAVHDLTEMATLLLEHGAEVDAFGFEPGRGLATPLVLATAEAGLEMVQLLLARGADPNLGSNCETPLYTAVESSMEEKVRALLDAGARHDIFTAAVSGDAELVVYHLKAHPELLKARSLKRNRTPWEEAALHDRDEVMRAVRNWTEEIKKEPEPKAAEEESHWGAGNDDYWGGGGNAENEPSEAPATPAAAPGTPAEPDGDWVDWVDTDSAWPG